MPIDLPFPSLTDHADAVTLPAPERAQVERIARGLVARPPRPIDDPVWLEAAMTLSATLPARLRERLRRFRHDAGQDGMVLLRNLPIADEALPPTPNVPGSVQRLATVPASVLALVAFQIGELFAFREEKSGAMIQDVVPVPGMEHYQGNAGSAALTMHVENAFHVNRPDYVALLCLRNDHDDLAGLEVACARRALHHLSERVRAVLSEPRYVTAAPASFGAAGGAARPHALLTGSQEDPDVRVDYTSTRPLDGVAAEAMAELGRALRQVSRSVVLRPGDLAIVDNRLALHGRSDFRPRYDGRDRWLQRAFIQLDYRASRALRPGGGRVVHGG
ncbi:clavaminate synthase family protein [Nonomuraea antimicrobica]|uniref:Clavaminate synthase family protein n=1 Tax=Nonomuraea antimicrobica TaxID=561173 RepID=A0ABP7B4R8_9ACTN